MRHLLSAATLAVLLSGGSVAAFAAAPTAPTAYMQLNSPGDGVSNNAVRTGNGRMRRQTRRYRMHHHRMRHHGMRRRHR